MIRNLLRRIFPESIKRHVRRLVVGDGRNYRDYLFEDVVARLGGVRPLRILEIGPKDGKDTARLLTLDPEHMLLVELEDKADSIDSWYPNVRRPGVELRYGNLMYEAWVDDLEPFDLVWCTGVLYHNPEQLRMIARLFDLTRPGGLLVLESGTARRRFLADENCVEIWYPPPAGKLKRKYHVSGNVSHVPSRRAIESWLAMTGFSGIARSICHSRQSRALARTRAAYIAERGREPGVYYAIRGHAFRIGMSR